MFLTLRRFFRGLNREFWTGNFQFTPLNEGFTAVKNSFTTVKRLSRLRVLHHHELDRVRSADDGLHDDDFGSGRDGDLGELAGGEERQKGQKSQKGQMGQEGRVRPTH